MFIPTPLIRYSPNTPYVPQKYFRWKDWFFHFGKIYGLETNWTTRIEWRKSWKGRNKELKMGRGKLFFVYLWSHVTLHFKRTKNKRKKEPLQKVSFRIWESLEESVFSILTNGKGIKNCSNRERERANCDWVVNQVNGYYWNWMTDSLFAKISLSLSCQQSKKNELILSTYSSSSLLLDRYKKVLEHQVNFEN